MTQAADTRATTVLRLAKGIRSRRLSDVAAELRLADLIGDDSSSGSTCGWCTRR